MVFVSVLMSNLAIGGDDIFRENKLHFNPTTLTINASGNIQGIKNSGTVSIASKTLQLERTINSVLYTSLVDTQISKFLRFEDDDSNNKSKITFNSSDTGVLSRMPSDAAFVFYAWINVMVDKSLNSEFDIIGTRDSDLTEGARFFGKVTSISGSGQFQLCFETYNGSNNQTFQDTTVSYNFGTWYFVAFTRNASTIKFFKNGSPEFISTQNVGTLYTPSTLSQSSAFIGGTQTGCLYLGHFGMHDEPPSFNNNTWNTIISDFYDETKAFYYPFDTIVDLDFYLDPSQMQLTDTSIINRGSALTNLSSLDTEPRYLANLSSIFQSTSISVSVTLHNNVKTLYFDGQANNSNKATNDTNSAVDLNHLPFQYSAGTYFNDDERLSQKKETEFSFFVWAKPIRTTNNYITGNENYRFAETIFSNIAFQSTALDGYALVIEPENYKVSFVTQIATGINSSVSSLSAFTDGNVIADKHIIADKWVMIGIQVSNYTASGNIQPDTVDVKIFINGKQTSGTATTMAFEKPSSSAGGFSFGKRGSPGQVIHVPGVNENNVFFNWYTKYDNFKGYLGKFGFFNKALTNAEFQTIYESTYQEYGLAAYSSITIIGSVGAASASGQTTYTIRIASSTIFTNPAVSFITYVVNPNVFPITIYNQPDLNLQNKKYIFDVSDTSNSGRLLQFNTTADSYDATFESNYVTRTGTPGSSGATVTLELTFYSGSEVFYFDSATAGMGYVEAPTSGVTTKVVTVALDTAGTANVYYIDTVEKDQITFAASTTYIFDQSDSTNAGHQIVFGTTSDDTNNIYQPSDGVTIMGTPGQPGAYTKLVLPNTFTGTLFYYCYSHTGMGYSSNYSTIFSNVTDPSFYWDFRTTSPLTDATGDYVEDVINGSIKARAVGNLSFNSLSGPTFNDNDYVDIDDFKFGGACSIEVYFNVTQFTSLGRIIDFASSTSGGDNVILRVDNNGITFQLRIGTGTTGQIKPNIYSSVSTNTWYHVIATVESSGNVEAYVDGSSTNLNATFNSSGGGVVDVLRTVNYAGNDTWNSGGQNLNGNLAFVRVWYGHVLSQAEVTSLYSNVSLIGNDK